jgi:tetrahydromethanopterin S-methyltransferase subunit G
LNHQNPLLPALLSIDLEQEARLDDHEERLEELEQRLSNAGSEQQQSSVKGDTGGTE